MMSAKNETIAAGVDLGGTTFKVGLITRGGEVIASQEYDTPRSNSRPLALDAIAAAIPGLMESATVKPEQMAGVGLGIPGPVDPDAGVIKQCPNLHELDGVEAGKRLSSALALPVFVGNDAYCATLAELRYGAGRDIANLVMLTLGTGVGGGIALDNQVRRGPRQIMGEIGHLIVQPGGPRCGCGNHGCLEAIVGRDGIVERAVRLLETGRASSLEQVAGPRHEDLTPKAISEAAGAGDAVALQVMGETGYYIGLALCSCIVLADPDLIVIGGGIAAAGDVLLGPIQRTVRHCSMISGFDATKIVVAELAGEAGMYGAAALAWERLADQ
jgi:glucokinase